MNEIILQGTAIVVTEKERELIQTYANDATRSLAAQILNVNKRTLDGRLERLKRKAGLKSTAGLVFLFAKNGLIK